MISFIGELYLNLFEAIPNLENKMVLEVGCGIGRWLDFVLSKGADYIGVDISTKMVRIARRSSRGEFLTSSAESLPY